MSDPTGTFPTAFEAVQIITENAKRRLEAVQFEADTWVQKTFIGIVAELKRDIIQNNSTVQFKVTYHSYFKGPSLVRMSGIKDLELKLENFLKKHGYKNINIQHGYNYEYISIYFTFD